MSKSEEKLTKLMLSAQGAKRKRTISKVVCPKCGNYIEPEVKLFMELGEKYNKTYIFEIFAQHGCGLDMYIKVKSKTERLEAPDITAILVDAYVGELNGKILEVRK